MKDIIDDWGELWTRPPGDTDGRRSSPSTEQHQQVPDPYVDDFDVAVDALVAVYDTPPFDISRRAYLELSLAIAEIVLGDDADSARISSGQIYSSLSDQARAEVEPSKGGIGITNVGNAPSVFTTKREIYKQTLYRAGQGLRQAWDAVRRHFHDAEIDEIADATDALATKGDVQHLEELRVDGGNLENRAAQRTDNDQEEDRGTVRDRTDATDGVPQAPGGTPLQEGEGQEGGSGEGPNGHPGAIGEGVASTESRLDLGAAPTDRDIGDGNLSRLDSDHGQHDSPSEPQTDGYVLTEMRGNYLQRDLLTEKVAHVPSEIQTAYRHFIIHLLTSAQIYWTDAWHAMHSKEVLIKQLPGGWALDEVQGGTSRLWDFEESVVQSREGGDYTPPGASGGEGRTREYRIDPQFAIEFWELAEKADAHYKLHSEDGESGKRARSSPALTTTLRDEGGNRWGTDHDLPTGHYSLPDGALRVLSDTEHKIDISQATEMKTILREEYLEAKATYQQAKKTYKDDAYLDEEGNARTEQEAEAIREARTTMKAMKTRKQKAEGRYHSLLSGLEVIARQADRIEDGVAFIQNAYEIQEVSGRKSFRKGGPQGLPAVLKSFAYSMEDVYNYDIKSSQTTGLRQLAEDLRRVGYDVDTEALDTYIERGGKDWVIDNYDLPRSLVKRVEHAIKFGGSIPDSMEAAYHLKLNDDNGFDMPEIAEHVEEHYSDREEQNRALDDLKEVFGPQVQMIKDLAEGLITAYWDAHSRAGGRGKGRTVRNHCGITFCKFDHSEGHVRRSKAMAWYLQGLEAAYIDAITILSTEYDYAVMANEHDGVITSGRVPGEAKERAREISGSRRAKLVDKRFEDEDDVRELCDEHGFDYPSPPLEDTDEETCNKQQTNPGANGQPPRPTSGDGSGSTTSPTSSNPRTKSESTSNGATPAGGGPSATTTPAGAGRAGPAPSPADIPSYPIRRCDRPTDEEMEREAEEGRRLRKKWEAQAL